MLKESRCHIIMNQVIVLALHFCLIPERKWECSNYMYACLIKQFHHSCTNNSTNNTLALPVLLYGSETWTIKARDARRITAAEMKYMRRTAGFIWTDYKTNAQIAKDLKITPILDKLLEYKRNWIQHVNRMPRNRLPRVMEHYSPTWQTFEETSGYVRPERVNKWPTP